MGSQAQEEHHGRAVDFSRELSKIAVILAGLSTLPLGSVACAASSLLSAAGAAFTAIAIEELRPVLAAEARGEGT